jgi:hypothetical protein
MRPYRAALAVAMIVLVGWAGVSQAAERRGGHPGAGVHGGGGGVHDRHGGGQGFRGGRGAFHGGHGFHGHPGFHRHSFIGVAPFWWGPSYVYPPPVYVAPPPSGYWYYCPSARTYYPYVTSCPDAWIPVPAS